MYCEDNNFNCTFKYAKCKYRFKNLYRSDIITQRKLQEINDIFKIELGIDKFNESIFLYT